jgi:predicted TIM-barrel fold metal-dependent hydrolase
MRSPQIYLSLASLDHSMDLQNFQPNSKLIIKQSKITRAKFPVFDAHNHLMAPFGGGWEQKPFNQLIDQLDNAGINHYVDLDGGWGESILNDHLDLFKARAPERFSVFGGVDWSQWQEKGDQFPEWAAGRIRVQKKRGAEGLKIWKGFGLNVVDQNGQLVTVDDRRLDPIWHTCAELQLPVIIHIADPVAFFDPIDASNERWEELGMHPDWAFTSPPYPPFLNIIEAFANLITRHPQTTFIGAHVGCYSENLGWVENLLARCPNFYVDISARISELGRQPYTARKFFLKFPDRILFGLDLGPDVESYQIYFRFLETDDEYFYYNTGKIPLQGRWQIYGLFLPDDVLEKVYFQNAEKIILKQSS